MQSARIVVSSVVKVPTDPEGWGLLSVKLGPPNVQNTNIFGGFSRTRFRSSDGRKYFGSLFRDLGVKCSRYRPNWPRGWIEV